METHLHNLCLDDCLKEFFIDFKPFRDGCTEECRQKILKFLEDIHGYVGAQIAVFKNLKKNEDGTLPKISFVDVFPYYMGIVDDDEKINNIQDLFGINLLDLNIPFHEKRTDIPKSEEENKTNVTSEEIKKN